jgi:hypothetical protein
MPTDPEHQWHEPAENFRYPPDAAGFLKSVFGTRLDDDDIQWLAGLLARLSVLGLAEALELPPPQGDYRRAALRCAKVLAAIDSVMSQSKDHARSWAEVSSALCLPSSQQLHLTQERIGQQFGVSRSAIRKSVGKLIRLAELPVHQHGYNGRQVN